MAGRGRGRGRGAIFQKESNPGGLQDFDADPALLKIKKTISSKDVSAVGSVVETARTYCSDKPSLARIINAVYSPCFEDWKCSILSAPVCQQLSTEPLVPDVVFRTVLLKTIQSDYLEKESLRLKSKTRFIGFVAFLCQNFKHLLVNGQPLKVLIAPVVECLSMLLDENATEEEVVCACEQLLAVGTLLHSHADHALLAALKPHVRNQILDTSLGREVRSRLLDVLEAMASNWSIDYA